MSRTAPTTASTTEQAFENRSERHLLDHGGYERSTNDSCPNHLFDLKARVDADDAPRSQRRRAGNGARVVERRRWPAA